LSLLQRAVKIATGWLQLRPLFSQQHSGPSLSNCPCRDEVSFALSLYALDFVISSLRFKQVVAFQVCSQLRTRSVQPNRERWDFFCQFTRTQYHIFGRAQSAHQSFVELKKFPTKHRIYPAMQIEECSRMNFVKKKWS
jgi:hypothetical protein